MRLKAAEPTVLAHDAWLQECAQSGLGVGWQPSSLAGELADEFSSIAIVLTHVVVVDGLLDQPSGLDERIDGGGCGVGHAEERLAVDLAEDPSVALDGRVWADHL